MSEIIENVKTNGDKAVYDYTVKFDGKAPEKAEISADEIDAVISECDPKYIETVRRAAKILRISISARFSRAGLPQRITALLWDSVSEV